MLDRHGSIIRYGKAKMSVPKIKDISYHIPLETWQIMKQWYGLYVHCSSHGSIHTLHYINGVVEPYNTQLLGTIYDQEFTIIEHLSW